MNETQSQSQPAQLPIWSLGFRPFFLAAGIFAVIGILLWLLGYKGAAQVYPGGLPTTLWHAHEMLFGYAQAVITGFLLTAVKNWTGEQTPHRLSLAILLILWVVARAALHLGGLPLAIGATADLLFNALVIIAVTRPIIKTSQWKQMAIIGKLVFLAGLNAAFYLDAFGLFDGAAYWSVYAAFYTILALILMMCRRLIPFFVENGVGYNITLRQSKVLDIGSLVVFLGLMVGELSTTLRQLTPWCAGVLFVIHLARLAMWYTPGIWRRPLLWSLYLAYVMMVTGFLLLALSAPLEISKFLAMHMFAIGGVGIITLSMMSRVSLGHTGRSIHEVPRLVSIAVILLAASALVRVVGPLLNAGLYVRWVEIAGGLWILAFLAFTGAYAPMLLKARIDGRYN